MIKNYKAAAAIGANLIIKVGANDNEALPAAGSTDDLLGASTKIDSAIGEPCDVIHSGIADILLGGAVARGKFITSDATGRGIQAAPGTGVNAQVVGKALVSGVSGDIISALVNVTQIQG